MRVAHHASGEFAARRIERNCPASSALNSARLRINRWTRSALAALSRNATTWSRTISVADVPTYLGSDPEVLTVFLDEILGAVDRQCQSVAEILGEWTGKVCAGVVGTLELVG